MSPAMVRNVTLHIDNKFRFRKRLKEIIQIVSYRLAKPLKPIFSPKVEKSDAKSQFLGQK